MTSHPHPPEQREELARLLHELAIGCVGRTNDGGFCLSVQTGQHQRDADALAAGVTLQAPVEAERERLRAVWTAELRRTSSAGPMQLTRGSCPSSTGQCRPKPVPPSPALKERPMGTYVFEEVRRTAVKSVPCSKCGRKVRRQRTFTNTINPWNLNAAGEPASRAEIQEKLRVKAEAWQAEPEAHARCAPGGATDGE